MLKPSLFPSYLIILASFFTWASLAFGQIPDSIRPDSAHRVPKREEPREIVPIEKLVRYPQEARRHGIEGKVILQALIDTIGHVLKVQIVRSSDPVFSEAATQAIMTAQFTPAKVDGKPIKLWITRSINFNLRER
jgi:TonB family protein